MSDKQAPNKKVPRHWRPVYGPCAWYRLQCPPDWVTTLESGVLTLSPPGSNAMLQLHTQWYPVNDGRQSTLEERLRDRFPRSRVLELNPELGGPSRSWIARGEARLEPNPPWYLRFWDRRVWRRWQSWALSSDSLGVSVLLLHDLECDPEFETLAQRVVDSIVLADEPGVPPEIFRDRVRAYAREHYPDENCSLEADFRLRMGCSSLSLDNLYRVYLRDPQSFNDLIGTALKALCDLQSDLHDESRMQWNAVRHRIMPMLAPEARLGDTMGDSVSAPWIADLAIVYVVDEEQTYWYLRDELLARWGVDRETVHELAMTNLERYFDEHSMEVTVLEGQPGPRIVMPTHRDAYNTTRILSPAFQQELRRSLGSCFAVGAPNRDFFVASSLEPVNALEQIRLQVGADFQRMTHPLTDRLLMVTPDGVCEYSSEPLPLSN